jgi:hypothetical protein
MNPRPKTSTLFKRELSHNNGEERQAQFDRRDLPVSMLSAAGSIGLLQYRL